VFKIGSYFEHDEEAKFVRRLYGLLLFAGKPDESCDGIGALFGNSPRRISNRVRRVNETGDMASLRGVAQSGRPSRLGAEEKAEIGLVSRDNPERHGISANIGDGKSLSAYIFWHYGIMLKTRSRRNLFRESGFGLKRARAVVARGNEKQKGESKKPKEKTDGDDYGVRFEDERHFKFTLSIIRAWFWSGRHPEIKSPVGRHKTGVFGATGKNGQLITLENGILNARTFKLFLEKLILKAKRGTEKILSVLDNVRYRHAKILKDRSNEVSNVLELFFPPPYSPDSNPIGILWKKTGRGITHNGYFKSQEELRVLLI
jgi:transposase